jgi:hypothetical protein
MVQSNDQNGFGGQNGQDGYGAPDNATMNADNPADVTGHDLETPAVERMPPQVYVEPGELSEALLPNKLRKYYKSYREMRTDPTIAFARMLCIAPLIQAGWVYKDKPGSPEGAKEFIEQMFEPLRMRLVKTALEGFIDFGWSPYEMVKKVDEWGYITVTKFKPLLNTFTDILVDKDHGEYVGLRQEQGKVITDLSIYDSLCIMWDVEGTDYYGTPLMENARAPYTAWNVVESASDRYDKKIAGSHWVIHYPVGSSPYNGVDTDNFAIAKSILQAMESSGKVVVPRKMEQFIDDLNAQKSEDAWKIELLSDNGSVRAQFIERSKYLDALKVRAFGIPERAILEGQFGTKAESETQADFAIVTIEVRHSLLCQQISQQAVNLVLDLNWGKEYRDTVAIEPNPLSDDKMAFFRQLYVGWTRDPQSAAAEMNTIDLPAFRDRLGLPKQEVGDVYGQMQSEYDPNAYVGADPNDPTQMPAQDPSQPQALPFQQIG